MFRIVVIAALALGLTTMLVGAAMVDPTPRAEVARPTLIKGSSLELKVEGTQTRHAFLDFRAVFTDRHDSTRFTAIAISLKEGEHVAFAVPGYPAQRFRFMRRGAEVHASVELLSLASLAE